MPKRTKIEEFDNHVKHLFVLLEQANSPAGFLRLLPFFFEKIQNFPSSAKTYQTLLADLEKEDQELRKHKEKLINWMVLRLDDLKKSNCFIFSKKVKDSIFLAERFLKGELNEIIISGSSYLGSLIGYFKGACEAVATFGKDDCFKNWMEIKPKTVSLKFNQKNSIYANRSEISPFSFIGKKLLKKIRHGFVKAFLWKNDFCPNELSCDIEYCIVDSINFPHDSFQAWKKSEDIYQWKINMDCDPKTNLRYLLILSKFCNLNPTPTHLLPRPKTIFEAEELNNQQVLQLYLSHFFVEWDKAPISREEILNLTRRMVIFFKEAVITAEARAIKGPRVLKEEARKFIWDALKEILLPLSSKERAKYKYDDMLPLIWKKALSSEIVGLQQACSKTLIIRECKKFAKKYDWPHKRGKAQKKERSL